MTTTRAPALKLHDGVAVDLAADVTSAFTGAGWRLTDGQDWDLLWVGEGAELTCPEPRRGRLVNSLPAVASLSQLEVLHRIVEQGQQRAIGLGLEPVPILPRTYFMPGEEESFQAAAAAPDTSWVQRPRRPVDGLEDVALAHPAHAEPFSRWVLQEARPGHPGLVEGRLRLHVLVRSLEPLWVIALDGPEALGFAGDQAEALALRLQAATSAVIASAREHLLGFADGTESVAWSEDSDPAPGAGRFALLAFDFHLDPQLAPRLLAVDPAPLARAPSPLRLRLTRAVAELCLPGAELCGVGVELCGPGAARRAPTGGRRVIFPSPLLPDAWGFLALPQPADLAAASAVGLDAPERPAPAPAPGAVAWPLAEGVALWLPERGELLALDPRGAYVLTALEDGLAQDALAAELAGASGVVPSEARRRLRGLIGELSCRGALQTEPGRTADAGDRSPCGRGSCSIPYLRWNQHRVVRCAGQTISVRVPTRRIGAWIDVGLEHLRHEQPATIDAFLEVSRQDGFWCVTGTHHAPAWCAQEQQLAVLVRELVLRSAARLHPGAILRGSALGDEQGTAVVLAPPAFRRRLCELWTARSRPLQADEVVALSTAGEVLPVRAGLKSPSSTHMIEREEGLWPDADGIVPDLDGIRVEIWSARTEQHAGTGTAPAPLLIVAGYALDLALSPVIGLGLLLGSRVAQHDPVDRDQAEALMRWLGSVDRHHLHGHPAAVAGMVEDLLEDRLSREPRPPAPTEAPAAAG